MLSGMTGGRHSVVGVRINDRAALSAGLSWTWLAAGCAAVLLPGLIGVWILARSSPAVAVTAPPAPAPAIVAVAEPAAPAVQIEPMQRMPALVPDPAPAAPAVRGPVHYYRHRRHNLSAAAIAAMTAANAANPGAASAGAAPAAAAAASGNVADQAPADSPEASDSKAAQADTPAADKPKKAVEAAPRVSEGERLQILAVDAGAQSKPAVQLEHLQALAAQAISEESWIQILKGLAAEAEYGNVKCAELLIQYAFGIGRDSPKPISASDP